MGRLIVNEFSFILPLTLSGRELKFNFSENFYVDIEFDQLKSQYMEIVINAIIKFYFCLL